MKTRSFAFLTLALLAGLALALFDASLTASAWHTVTTVDPTLLLAASPLAFIERKSDDPDPAPPAVLQVKQLVEELGTAFKTYRDTNDALIKGKAEGKSVIDLEAKLAKIDKDLDGLQEAKAAIDQIMAKMGRPNLGSEDEQKSAAAEVKSFNDMLRADFQSKGRLVPTPLTTEQYAQYKSAFFTLVRHGDLEKLSAEERKSLSAGSDPDGGFLLPTPTVGRIVQRVYESSVMRQIATVQPISTDSLEGIVDNDETDAGWVGETESREGNDGTPQVGKWKIEAHEIYAEPKATQKILDDAAIDIESWLAGKTGDKFARVEGAAFWQGNGVAKPRGLATYGTAASDDDTRAWGTFEHIATGANGDFHTTKADPLQDLLGAFRDRYLQNAQFVMRREVRTKLRKMKESTSDRYLWEPSLQAGQPDRLLGYTARVDQYMPALATGSLSLAFGDFREGYTIVDRIGIRTLRDPYTAKPYVKFYSTKRTGGGAVNFEAVKFLKFST